MITSVDVYVAERVRHRRLMAGLSMAYVAGELGVSCQQIAKYERAVDRISAGNLFKIASLLGVPVDYFYEELRHEGTAEPTSDPSWQALIPSGGRERQHIRSLVSAYSRIGNPKARRGVLDLMRTMAAKADEPASEVK